MEEDYQMTKTLVNFQRKIEKKNFDRENSYYACRYLLTIGGEILQIGYEKGKTFKQKRKELKHIAREISTEIFDAIFKIIPEGYRTVLKFSGLHNDYTQMATNLWQYPVIMHNHLWPEKLGYSCEEENYVITDCGNKRTMKRFLKKYWFSIDKEQRLEIIILNDRAYEKLLKWSRRVEGKRKEHALIKMSQLVIDNLECGIHFRIMSDKMDRSFFDSILNGGIEIESLRT
jgi:hypothetical protein